MTNTQQPDEDGTGLIATRRAVLTSAAGAAMLSQPSAAQIGGDENTRQWIGGYGSILLTESGFLFDDGDLEVDELLLVEGGEDVTTSAITFS